MRKLWPPKLGGQELKTTNHNQLLKTQNFPFYVVMLLLWFKDYFVEFKVGLLQHFKSFKMKKK
jgi:hypothetical protein